ncbi:MAG: GNAT family N-acetyltransferase [Ruminococcaceae bacterium]|nr:GNAT family N-acetyltransferase [Oscillospiraceae bacterium]
MIKYSTLENVSNEVLFETNLKTMSERLKREVNLDMFCKMLREQDYDPTISVGAFDTDTGECVSLVLNSILKDKEKTAYDIVTCTIPEYRRRGIARTIFEKVKVLLRERGIEIYTTETKRDNVIAQSMYQSLGFEITNEVVTTLKTLTGSRKVEQVEVVMKL